MLTCILRVQKKSKRPISLKLILISNKHRNKNKRKDIKI